MLYELLVKLSLNRWAYLFCTITIGEVMTDFNLGAFDFNFCMFKGVELAFQTKMKCRNLCYSQPCSEIPHDTNHMRTPGGETSLKADMLSQVLEIATRLDKNEKILQNQFPE